VAATLEAAVGILRKQTQEHTDRFELTVAEGLPAVRGSSQQLEQVFINVILNALQALPDRNCGVFVDASAPPGSGGVSIRVRDEGAGITKEHLEALTEPFFSTREDSGGTGLGLSISQSIIDKHGGRIEFESELGRGTTVTITLPVALAAEV
jgi:signal transduction histidine kinase